MEKNGFVDITLKQTYFQVEVHTYYIDKYGQERELNAHGYEQFKFMRCYFNRNHDLVFLVATYAPKYPIEEK